MARHDALPVSLPPRGLDRVQAAQYVGISPGHFDKQVTAGRFPRPKLIGGRIVWDRHALDAAFAALPDGDDAEPANPWDAA
jgi:predicted DNA-binding transcriptional regulator AlpA